MSFLKWQAIHTVFLDMDGTLLDLHFDSHFWLKYLPQCYAKHYKLSFDKAKATLLGHYQKKIGTLEWYCIDYWSTQLNMDIAQLKEDVAHLIAIHPHVIPFLSSLHQHHKRVVLVTNAHQKSLSLKMQRTKIAAYFDRIICAHDLGIPKESDKFWLKLQKIEPFNVTQTLLIDDSVPVLRSASHYGITHLLGIYQPDSQSPPMKTMTEFKTIRSFLEIMPG